MNPVWTDDCNVVYKGPRPDIGDLRCHRTAPGIIRVTYELTDEERQALLEGGYLQLHIMKEPIPPVALEVVPCDVVVVEGEHDWKVDVEPGDKLRKEKEDGEANATEQEASGTNGSAPQWEASDSSSSRAHGDDAPSS